MKKITVSGSFRFRMMSVLVVLVPSLSEFFRNRNLFLHSAGFCFLQGALFLLMSPFSHENKTLSRRMSAATVSLTLILCAAVPESEMKPAILLLSVGSAVLLFLVTGSLKNALKPKAVFNIRAPWQGMEEYVRLFSFNCLGLLSSIFTMMASHPGKTDYALCISGLCAYAVSYRTTYVGRSIFISVRKEKEIKDIIRSNITGTGNCDEYSDSRMTSLYRKMLNYIEKERPFLNDKFNEEQLAMALGTNISYISKCINLVSGSNFKNLVNSYRVDYAVNIIRKDTHLRVIEIAMMSGFSSTSSFNISFKQIMKMTPSEYIRAVQAEAL